MFRRKCLNSLKLITQSLRLEDDVVIVFFKTKLTRGLKQVVNMNLQHEVKLELASQANCNLLIQMANDSYKQSMQENTFTGLYFLISVLT